MSKNMYLAKKAIFPQLEAVIDVMFNLKDTLTKISEKHQVDEGDLMEWVKKEMDTTIYDEDEDDSDDEEDEDEDDSDDDDDEE